MHVNLRVSSKNALSSFSQIVRSFRCRQLQYFLLLSGISAYEHISGKNLYSYVFLIASGAFFQFGAYLAWKQIDDGLEAEKQRADLPSLDLDIKHAFFDVVPNQNRTVARVLIYVHASVTNLHEQEALIREARLSFNIRGIRYTGTGDVQTRNDTLEYSSSLDIVRDPKYDVVGSDYRHVTKLMAKVTKSSPLRRGLTEDGFLAFSFPDLVDWPNQHLMHVMNVELVLVDSLRKDHIFRIEELKITQAHLVRSMRSNRIPVHV